MFKTTETWYAFERFPICTSVKLAGQRDNLEQVFGSFIYNQLFIKTIFQLREEKCHRSQLL